MRKKIYEVLHNDYKLGCTQEQCDKLCGFVEMMLEYNKTHNLTAITNEFDIIYKHLLDSVLPIDMIGDGVKVLDIGCGGGFPSVPLALINKDLNITAIDSVGKKITFVNNVKNALNVDNLTAIHTRIEDYARIRGVRESFDVVLSRAVAPLNVIIEYSAPMLKDGGYIVAYKGSNYHDEIVECENALKELKCEIKECREYIIKEVDASRCVIKILKKSKIHDKYPRLQNKPRIQPL